MASLSEHAAASVSGSQDIGALFDVWAALAVREVLEPNLDDILNTYLKTLYRRLQGERQSPLALSLVQSRGRD